MKTNIICGLMVIIGFVMIGYSAYSWEKIQKQRDDEVVRRIAEACKRG